MIKMIDFSNCKLSSRNLEYGGRAGEKKGIFYNNEFWFLKFPKSTSGMNDIKGLSYATSPLSEYIAVIYIKFLDMMSTKLFWVFVLMGKDTRLFALVKILLKMTKPNC